MLIVPLAYLMFGVHSLFFWGLIIFPIISVALITTARIVIRRQIRRHSKKCEKCGKWDAMRRLSRKEYKRKQVSVGKTLVDVHRNKEGEVIKTVEKEVLVPGVEVYYEVKDECKFCGHLRIYIEIETE
jgi:hypothetical protein